MKFFKAVMLLTMFLTFSTINYSRAEEAAAPDGQKKITFEETEWAKRCQKDEKTGKDDESKCEVFKIIKVKDSNGMVAQFAIGKNTKANDGSYTGVTILPLGILLEEGVLMKIDDGSPVMFKPRFCSQVGCVSYMSLDTNLINTMKNGKNIIFSFMSSNGRKMNIDLGLSGFTKALKSIK